MATTTTVGLNGGLSLQENVWPQAKSAYEKLEAFNGTLKSALDELFKRPTGSRPDPPPDYVPDVRAAIASRNFSIRNLNASVAGLDDELLPMLGVDDGQPIAYFPKSYNAIGKLDTVTMRYILEKVGVEWGFIAGNTVELYVDQPTEGGDVENVDIPLKTVAARLAAHHHPGGAHGRRGKGGLRNVSHREQYDIEQPSDNPKDDGDKQPTNGVDQNGNTDGTGTVDNPPVTNPGRIGPEPQGAPQEKPDRFGIVKRTFWAFFLGQNIAPKYPVSPYNTAYEEQLRRQVRVALGFPARPLHELLMVKDM